MKILVKLGDHGATICETDAAVDDAIADALRDYTGIPGVAHNLDEIEAVRETKRVNIWRKLGRWIDLEDGRLRIEFDLSRMTARVVTTADWYSAEFGDGEKKVNKTELADALAAITAAWQTTLAGLSHWVTTGDRLTIEFDLLAKTAQVLPAGRGLTPADDRGNEKEK